MRFFFVLICKHGGLFMKLINKTAIALLSAFLVFSCAYAYHVDNNKATQTIAQLAVANPDLSTLVTALKKANLVDALNGKGPFTVFAPTNEAFNNLPQGILQKLLANPDQLKQVLLYHVLSSKLTCDKVKPGDLKTLQGQSVQVKVSNGAVYVNNAKVTAKNIMASNGVIHVINAVLVPPKQQ